jgi:2-polyprenyl-6-methoxyphenol hydroxylase-like FAD-dependent oxidoreductase
MLATGVAKADLQPHLRQVVVVGGGVGGLALALALGRQGHQVTVVERDPLPATATAEEAFAAERRGAPQVHQTHGFLARIFVELREHLPDVLDRLMAVGGITLPMASALGEPQPGDEDLKVLIVRRTTFEWVLREAAVAQPGVRFLTGEKVTGVVVEPQAPGTPAADAAVGAADVARAVHVAGAADATVPVGGTLPPLPRVTGAVLESGVTLAADAVVACTGRRGDVPAWLGAGGVEVPETVHESGLMYLSRWYRLPEGQDMVIDPKLGGDLGFVKYLAVPGDADTLSITLAIRPDDDELRKVLSDPAGFEAACRVLPGPRQFFDHGPLRPEGGVRPMGGLMNRMRTFVDGAGRPKVLGFHAVGDAHTCTNPLYGRGCSLALVQALRLADTFAAHPDDPEARALAYEQVSQQQVEPWFYSSVEMDKLGADPAGVGAAARGSGPGKAMAAVFAAATTDPIIGRGIARLWNLLTTPAEMMADTVLAGRMAEVMANPDAYPTPPAEGPTREELLERLAGVTPSTPPAPAAATAAAPPAPSASAPPTPSAPPAADDQSGSGPEPEGNDSKEPSVA